MEIEVSRRSTDGLRSGHRRGARTLCRPGRTYHEQTDISRARPNGYRSPALLERVEAAMIPRSFIIRLRTRSRRPVSAMLVAFGITVVFAACHKDEVTVYNVAKE